MSPRRIRVARVHADFMTPRGWPTPTDAWIRANVFWQPPAGWTPVPGLRPAPDGWRFWAPIPEWGRTAAGFLRPVMVWTRLGNWSLIGALVFSIASALLGEPDLRWGSVACFAVTGVSLVIFMATYVRRRRLLYARAVEAAEVQRAARLTRAYQSYLRDAS